MSAFEERKERKIERLQERILKKKKESESILNSARKMQDCIPFGQPILIGHHSEKGDRNFRKRIDQKRSKAFAMFDEIKELERRIQGIDRNNAILINDPEASRKIKNKIDILKLNVESSKQYNKILSKFKTYQNALTELQKIISNDEIKDDDKKQAEFILKCISKHYSYFALPPESIRAYYFSLTSQGAEIRRLEKRLNEVEAKNIISLTMKFEFSEVVDDGDYIKIDFSDKPSDEIRTILKSSPLVLKWSNFQKAWVRKKTAQVMTSYFKASLIDILEKYDEEMKK